MTTLDGAGSGDGPAHPTRTPATDGSPEDAPVSSAGGERRVWLLVAALTLTATAAAVPLIGADPVPGGLAVPWWVLVIAFAVAELLVVHLTFRRNSVSFSMNEVPITISFGAVSPLAGVAGRLVGSLVGLSTQRVRGVKLGFNLSCALLETVAAAHVYRAVIGAASPLDGRGWTAALAAALVVDLVNGVAIVAAMSLMDGRLDRSAVPQILVGGLVAATANTCLAIVTLIVIDADPRAGIALAVLATVVMLAYRSWAVQTRRYRHLETMYDFHRAVAEATDADALVHQALLHAAELTSASRVEIVLSPDGDATSRWTMSDGAVHRASSVAPSDGWWVGLDDAALVAPAGARDERTASVLERIGAKDALVAPIRSSRGSGGLLLAADREDDVSTFGSDELRLLETLAAHVAVEFDNVALLDQLRAEVTEKAHMAQHDALTGLPNRRWLTEHIESRLASRAGVAVAMMDLDRFKEINDTLGHAAGDRVLTAVARRLVDGLAGRGEVSRFGGDEFAVVIDSAHPDTVAAVTRDLSEALHQPLEIDDVTVDVAASIGVALAPEHGDDAETLLQHADVAMYFAKERQDGVEFYSFDRDVNDVRRLGLVSDLRRTIAAGGLDVHYQPQIDLRTGEMCSVEALVRWTSEVYGTVRPDEFVPLAECTGLIGPLTDAVLTTALTDCARWRAAGWRGSVSVNLSARSLLDIELPARVAAALVECRLPADALVLEITETNIMRDPDRTIELLQRLRDIGVRLSIDDFGTGYSSLSYLKRLPVAEIKIDRSFIADLDWDDDDRAITRATIRLAHDLGLTIVAEGVETRTTQLVLEEWGADIGQGYYFGRALPAEALGARFLALGTSDVSPSTSRP